MKSALAGPGSATDCDQWFFFAYRADDASERSNGLTQSCVTGYGYEERHVEISRHGNAAEKNPASQRDYRKQGRLMLGQSCLARIDGDADAVLPEQGFRLLDALGNPAVESLFDQAVQLVGVRKRAGIHRMSSETNVNEFPSLNGWNDEPLFRSQVAVNTDVLS
jgi:hypothetical protein